MVVVGGSVYGVHDDDDKHDDDDMPHTNLLDHVGRRIVVGVRGKRCPALPRVGTDIHTGTTCFYSGHTGR